MRELLIVSRVCTLLQLLEPADLLLVDEGGTLRRTDTAARPGATDRVEFEKGCLGVERGGGKKGLTWMAVDLDGVIFDLVEDVDLC